MTVRRSDSRVDTWDAVCGETRWVDYAAEEVSGDLIVYIHTFRRVRERAGPRTDVLFWKPSLTRVAHRYTAGEWVEVVRTEREWPPAEVQQVPRRPRRHLPD